MTPNTPLTWSALDLVRLADHAGDGTKVIDMSSMSSILPVHLIFNARAVIAQVHVHNSVPFSFSNINSFTPPRPDQTPPCSASSCVCYHLTELAPDSQLESITQGRA